MALRRGRRAISSLRRKSVSTDAGATMIRTPGQKFLDRALHGGGADQQRLLAPAPVEQPVGEDMAAVEIGGELDFVDRDESKVEVARHRLDGRNPVARRFSA